MTKYEEFSDSLNEKYEIPSAKEAKIFLENYGDLISIASFKKNLDKVAEFLFSKRGCLVSEIKAQKLASYVLNDRESKMSLLIDKRLGRRQYLVTYTGKLMKKVRHKINFWADLRKGIQRWKIGWSFTYRTEFYIMHMLPHVTTCYHT